MNVLLPVDISHFEPHINNIKHALIETKHLCNQTRIIEINVECDSMLQPLTARFHDMNKEFQSISHLIDNRNKRGAWIGGIGSVLKQIFGTLDENDALKYDEAITSLQNDESRLTSLIKENILITTSVIKCFNNTLNKVKHNEANLNEAIDNLSLNIRNISKITNGLHILTNVNRILNTLETSILTLSFQLEDIINAILFSSQNILHPSIMTPTQLHRELADNYRHLPSDLELPVTLDIKSVHLILSISKLACNYINNKLIFVLQVPLVNTKEYILFHNIALPTPHSTKVPNSFSLIIPSNKYIAMTKDKSHYCVLNNLEQCKVIGPGDYICDIENVYSTEAKLTCESELLAKVISEKPLQCETKIIFGKLDIWKPLLNNRWIYIQSEPNKISIDCLNSNLYETTILGTGILSIPNGCIGYYRSTTLIPKFNVLNITSPINHIPDFNLINDTCCNIVRLSNVLGDVSPVYLNDIDLDDLNKENKNKLQSLLSDVKVLEHSQDHHIIKYGTHYSILIIILVAIVILYVTYLIFKFFYKSGSNRHFQFKFNVNKTPNSLTPETLTMTDRQDPEQEISSIPIAPLRTKI